MNNNFDTNKINIDRTFQRLNIDSYDNYNPYFNNSQVELKSIQSNKVEEDTVSNQEYFNHFVKKPDFLRQDMKPLVVEKVYDNQLELLEQEVNIEDKMIKENRPSRNINNSNQIDYKEESSYKMPYENWNSFKKPNNLTYDNLNNDGKIEVITQNILTFDSMDRDIQKYPNPFTFRIKFNPETNTKDAFIRKNYKNVKFLSLDMAVFPRKFYIDQHAIGTITNDIINLQNLTLKANQLIDNIQILHTDTILKSIVIINSYVLYDQKHIIFTIPLSNITMNMEICWELIIINPNLTTLTQYTLNKSSLENEKFLLLFIDEIDNNQNFSTNQFIDRSFGMLMPNFINGDYLYMDTKIVEKIYKYSDLGIVDQITLKITNSRGIEISTNTEAYDMMSNMNICACQFVRDYSCVCTYMRHPFYYKFQTNTLFKVGYIEPNIDKRVFD